METSQTTIKTRVIGVDIKKDITTYAVVDIRGNILCREEFPTTDYMEISDFVAHLCECIIRLAEENGGYETIRSVGISVNSGNHLTGCIENASNLPWKGVVPLAALLRDQLGLAVALANNAHVTALGEHAFGSAHGMENFIIVSLGSGVGSCCFVNGHVHLGADGFAGELGHTNIVEDGRQCGCGSRGCLETYCSVYGMLNTAKEMLAESDEPSLMRNVEQLKWPMVIDAAEKGDKIALEALKKTGRILGLGVANYASLLNPEAIIFTGKLVRAGDMLLNHVYESFEEHVFQNIKGRVRFLRSLLDNQERDVLGASALAWGIKEYSLFK